MQPLPEPGAAVIDLNPSVLPESAIRTSLRMLAAMVLSLVFTFTYATCAAKSRRAEQILIPLLDILQSVPILGFFSVTIVFFMSLAPGRILLAGLLEAVAGPSYDGKADLPVIAGSLQMEIDDLFPAAETLQMLRFAEVAGGDIRLTAEAMRFAVAHTDERKRLFAQHLLTYVGLASHIRRVLDERPNHRAPWGRFSDELEDHMSPAAAEQTLRAIIDLGRYAEVFAYDDQTHIFSLDNP